MRSNMIQLPTTTVQPPIYRGWSIRFDSAPVMPRGDGEYLTYILTHVLCKKHNFIQLCIYILEDLMLSSYIVVYMCM